MDSKVLGKRRDRSPSSSIDTDRRRADGSVAAARSLHELLSHQEIFLRILGFLDATDLVGVQGVNRYWSHMSLDPQLWKRLYLSRYSHPHHSKLIYRDVISSPAGPSRTDGSRSRSRSHSLRPIARLPSRAFPPPSPSRTPTKKESTPFQISEVLAREGKAAGVGHAVPLDRRELDDSNIAGEIGSGVRNDGIDWKMMLRLGTNWSNGNVSSQTTISLPPSPSPTIASLDQISNLAESSSRRGKASEAPGHSEQHIALSPSFIFTSNPNSPLVHVHSSNSATATTAAMGIIPPPPGWSSPNRPDNVTAICADQAVLSPEESGYYSINSSRSDLPAQLAVFYESGGFVVLRVRGGSSTGGTATAGRITWTRESIHPPTSRPKSIRRRATTFTPLQGDPIVLAALHHPVLITCTLAFHLSVYTVSTTGPDSASIPTRPKHLSTMHSDVSFHPAALSLIPTSSSNLQVLGAPPSPPEGAEGEVEKHYRADLTYCTPLYPSSWTVAVQEFGIDLDIPRLHHTHSSNAPTDEIGGQVWRGGCFHVGRPAMDEEDLETDKYAWPKKFRPIIGVKASKAIGIGTDGRWCILAGGDNQIQVYSLPTPSRSPSPDSSPTLYTSRGVIPLESGESSRIMHSQTLMAHAGDITSISLSAGKCISGGRDGRVLIWDLDAAEDEVDDRMNRHGRTVGYVEIKPGGRRSRRQESTWRGSSGQQQYSSSAKSPLPTQNRSSHLKQNIPLDMATGDSSFKEDDDEAGDDQRPSWPHPQSISSAARSLFLPPLPVDQATGMDDRPAIKQLAFDEEKIVGLISEPGAKGDIMKVWNFNI